MASEAAADGADDGSPDAGELVVETFALTKQFGPRIGAIDLHLHVKRGEIYGFLGPNGAGKSTTLRMLTGVTRPDAGSAVVLGLDPRVAGPELMERVGVLNSESAFAPHHTGASQIELIGRIRRLRSFTPRANALAERFELDLTRKARDLSLGNRQKLGLVLALAHEPELLILDEPTSGLDPLMQRHVDDHLRELAQAGTSILLSSHSLLQIERVADRVGFIRDARLVTEGPLSALHKNHVHRATMTFPGPAQTAWFASLNQGASTHDATKVTDVALIGTTSIEVAWSGSATPVLARAAEHHVLTIHTDHNDLEHAFLAMYQPPQRLDSAPDDSEEEPI